MEKGHGGKRKGSGRKPKIMEQKIVEKLSPLDDIAFKSLRQGLQDGESWAVKLFFNYRFGMPVQKNINVETDIDDLLEDLEDEDLEDYTK